MSEIKKISNNINGAIDDNKISIQFSFSRKDIMAGYRFSFFSKIIIPIFTSISIIFFINLITGLILYIVLIPPLILIYFIIGKKQYSKNKKYQEEHYIKIFPNGIDLCDNKWTIIEALLWSDFSKASWNNKVIVLFQKESKNKIIIPKMGISKDKLDRILAILENVFKSKTYFN